MAVMFEDVVSSNHSCSSFVCLPIFERQERLVPWLRNICGGVKTEDAPDIWQQSPRRRISEDHKCLQVFSTSS